MAIRKVGSARILAEVGRGGMGVVFAAEQENLERRVAIKELPEDQASRPEVAERFRREGRAHAMLHHQAIPAVFDLLEKNGALYLVTEFVDGADLAKVMQKGGALPPECAALVGAVVADALHHVHTRQLLHRDIKPSNIMLTKDGEVKLMDFGIAKDASVTDLTQEGLLVGSPSYMAPEVLTGSKAGPASDLWALGVTLYELLAGEKPFKGKEHPELFANIAKGRFVPLRKKVPGIPKVLSSAVERCLATKPEKRWRNAGDVARALSATAQWMVPDVNGADRLVAMLVNRGLVQVDEVTVMELDVLNATRALDHPEKTPHWKRSRRWPWVMLLGAATAAAGASATGWLPLP
jgi:serine/threonine protein kinase